MWMECAAQGVQTPFGFLDGEHSELWVILGRPSPREKNDHEIRDQERMGHKIRVREQIDNEVRDCKHHTHSKILVWE